tara:strand:- start:69 stop:1589 length:1521 start_codon:yes stop_codon:yes gene_type:complete
MKYAIISVWDKTGIESFAKYIACNGYNIISTGGTKQQLEDSGLEVISVSEITGNKAILDGRVKTIDYKLFGGILADQSNQSHIQSLLDIEGISIDLVVVNFYPFEEFSKKNLPLDELINYVDIGGPSMIRAAAKNYKSCIPICKSSLYNIFIEKFKASNGDLTDIDRQFFLKEAFKETSKYDLFISNVLSKDESDDVPKSINLSLGLTKTLRYGENPHQKAAFYIENNKTITKHQGKSLSYNNYLDIESAWSIVSEFSDSCCVIIKHSNPCGFSVNDDLSLAFEDACKSDPVSFFGGIVGFNSEVDSSLAKKLTIPFLECIIAPSFSDKALEIFKNKKNLRIITPNSESISYKYSLRSTLGGFLYQERDLYQCGENEFKVVTKAHPSCDEMDAVKLGWKLVKYVKSNAIIINNNRNLLGTGAGQMSRVDSVKIAIGKAAEFSLNLDQSIMASDAFFPFPDSLDLASEAGVRCIVQPGGSIKDDEIIARANELGISMLFTGKRHFLH